MNDRTKQANKTLLEMESAGEITAYLDSIDPSRAYSELLLAGEDGNTVLHLRADANDAKSIEAIMTFADKHKFANFVFDALKKKNIQGETALHLAAEQEKALAAILASLFAVDGSEALKVLGIANRAGRSPLHLIVIAEKQSVLLESAKSSGKLSAALLLGDEKQGRSLLHFSIYEKENNKGAISQISEYSKDLNTNDKLDVLLKADKFGNTPLHWLMDVDSYDDDSFAKILSIVGRDMRALLSVLRAKNNEEETAIDTAFLNKNEKAIEALYMGILSHRELLPVLAEKNARGVSLLAQMLKFKPELFTALMKHSKDAGTIGAFAALEIVEGSDKKTFVELANSAGKKDFADIVESCSKGAICGPLSQGDAPSGYYVVGKVLLCTVGGAVTGVITLMGGAAVFGLYSGFTGLELAVYSVFVALSYGPVAAGLGALAGVYITTSSAAPKTVDDSSKAPAEVVENGYLSSAYNIVSTVIKYTIKTVSSLIGGCLGAALGATIVSTLPEFGIGIAVLAGAGAGGYVGNYVGDKIYYAGSYVVNGVYYVSSSIMSMIYNHPYTSISGISIIGAGKWAVSKVTSPDAQKLHALETREMLGMADERPNEISKLANMGSFIRANPLSVIAVLLGSSYIAYNLYNAEIKKNDVTGNQVVSGAEHSGYNVVSVIFRTYAAFAGVGLGAAAVSYITTVVASPAIIVGVATLAAVVVGGAIGFYGYDLIFGGINYITSSTPEANIPQNNAEVSVVSKVLKTGAVLGSAGIGSALVGGAVSPFVGPTAIGAAALVGISAGGYYAYKWLYGEGEAPGVALYDALAVIIRDEPDANSLADWQSLVNASSPEDIKFALEHNAFWMSSLLGLAFRGLRIDLLKDIFNLHKLHEVGNEMHPLMHPLVNKGYCHKVALKASYLAVESGDVELVTTIVSMDPSLLISDNAGKDCTLLHIALSLSNNSEEMVKAILKHLPGGPKHPAEEAYHNLFFAKNRDNKTPLEISAELNKKGLLLDAIKERMPESAATLESKDNTAIQAFVDRYMHNSYGPFYGDRRSEKHNSYGPFYGDRRSEKLEEWTQLYSFINNEPIADARKYFEQYDRRKQFDQSHVRQIQTQSTVGGMVQTTAAVLGTAAFSYGVYHVIGVGGVKVAVSGLAIGLASFTLPVDAIVVGGLATLAVGFGAYKRISVSYNEHKVPELVGAGVSAAMLPIAAQFTYGGITKPVAPKTTAESLCKSVSEKLNESEIKWRTACAAHQQYTGLLKSTQYDASLFHKMGALLGNMWTHDLFTNPSCNDLMAKGKTPAEVLSYVNQTLCNENAKPVDAKQAPATIEPTIASSTYREKAAQVLQVAGNPLVCVPVTAGVLGVAGMGLVEATAPAVLPIASSKAYEAGYNKIGGGLAGGTLYAAFNVAAHIFGCKNPHNVEQGVKAVEAVGRVTIAAAYKVLFGGVSVSVGALTELSNERFSTWYNALSDDKSYTELYKLNISAIETSKKISELPDSGVRQHHKDMMVNLTAQSGGNISKALENEVSCVHFKELSLKGQMLTKWWPGEADELLPPSHCLPPVLPAASGTRDDVSGTEVHYGYMGVMLAGGLMAMLYAAKQATHPDMLTEGLN